MPEGSTPRAGSPVSPRRAWMVAGLGSLLALGPALVGGPRAVAAFADETVTATSTFGAAPDWVAPEVGSTTIAKTTGYLAGSVKQGGSYHVYANVGDTGNPPSGVDVEKADVSAVTSAGSAVTLVAGAYSVGGVTYNYRSGVLTAANPLPAGPYQYSIASTDVAANSRIQGGFTVTVDNTAPTATDVQAANTSAGTVGRAEAGDTITFTHGEQIDPESVLAGWSGTATDVVVRLVDGGCALNLLIKICSDDSFVIRNAANSANLPLGTVDLNRDDYHGGGLIGTATPLDFGASGTPSTMVQSGATITVTLGTGSTTATTASGSGTMAWSPAAGPYDGAGNALSTTGVAETGGGDKEF